MHRHQPPHGVAYLALFDEQFFNVPVAVLQKVVMAISDWDIEVLFLTGRILFVLKAIINLWDNTSGTFFGPV